MARPGARGALRGARIALLALLLPGCAKLGLPTPGAAPGAALPVLEAGAKPPARVVMVSVAGMSPAHYLAAEGEAAVMPTTAALGRAGVAAGHVEAVAPATSYPAHATLVTGRAPVHHGITADRLLGDHGSEWRRPTPRPPLRAPALWDAVAASGRRSVALGWPGSSGGRIDLVFPESFVMTPEPDWKEWLAAHASPGLLGAAAQLGAEDPAVRAAGPARDRTLTGLACEVLRSKTPPALLLLHLSQAEPPLLQEGPDAPASKAALTASDREIGRLVDCLREAGFLDSTALLVAGDHGAQAVHTAVYPNALLREVGLIVPEMDGRTPKRWSAWVRASGGSAFVHARTDEDARLARVALEGLAARTGAFRVVAAREMGMRGAEPSAFFALEAEPGFWIGEALDAPLVTAAPLRGSWGSVDGAGAPGFVAWGRGVQSGARIDTLRQADIAPTAAVLLGFELGELDGQALAGVLSLPAVSAPPAPDGKEAPHVP